MKFLDLIFSLFNYFFKGITNEKSTKEDENGRTKVNGYKEGEQSSSETSSQNEKENEQKSLQVTGGYMIALKELLKGKDFNILPKEHRDNLMILLERINKIRTAYGKPMTVTSGYRSMDEHLEIYRKKGITDKSKIPMNSRHLSGQAVDIYDPNKILQSWILSNIKVLEEVGLWCEDFSATINWVHFQIIPPASGKRFFKP